MQKRLRTDSLPFSILLFAGAFLFTRLPFFLWAPIVDYNMDTLGYFMPVEQLMNHQLPDFSQIPFGYPVFLYVTGLLSNKLMTIVIIQNAVSFSAAIILIYVLHRHWKNITLWAALALIAYYIGSFQLRYDTTILPESLFASSLILCSAAMIEAIHSRSVKVWLLFGMALAVPFTLRANGVFIVAFVLTLAGYVLFTKRGWKLVLAVALPLALTAGAWTGLNKAASGKPAFSVTGTYSSTGNATHGIWPAMMFIRPDPKYPGYMNEYIEAELNLHNPDDLKIIYTSLNPFKIRAAYDRLWEAVNAMGADNFIEKRGELSQKYLYTHGTYDAMSKMTGDVIRDARRKGWFLYFKYVMATLTRHVMNIATDLPQFYYTYTPDRYYRTYVMTWIKDGDLKSNLQKENVSGSFRKLVFKELYPAPARKIDIDQFRITSSRNYYLKAYHLLYKFEELVFRNVFWAVSFTLLFFLSIFRLVKSRLNDTASLVVFMLCCLHIFSGLVVSLVQNPHNRYSFPTEFVVYLTAAFLPLLSKRDKVEKKSTPF